MFIIAGGQRNFAFLKYLKKTQAVVTNSSFLLILAWKKDQDVLEVDKGVAQYYANESSEGVG